MTKEEQAIVDKHRKDFEPDTPDDVILAESRFIDDGAGLEVYDSEEEWRAAMKKQNR